MKTKLWAMWIALWLCQCALLCMNLRLRVQCQETLRIIDSGSSIDEAQTKTLSQHQEWIGQGVKVQQEFLQAWMQLRSDIRGLQQTMRSLVWLQGECCGPKVAWKTNVFSTNFLHWRTNVSRIELGRWGDDWGLGYSNDFELP